jgi:hypothetical protein
MPDAETKAVKCPLVMANSYEVPPVWDPEEIKYIVEIVTQTHVY